ncbi:MAG: hypothetical protein V1784_07685, partial [bacterium]
DGISSGTHGRFARAAVFFVALLECRAGLETHHGEKFAGTPATARDSLAPPATARMQLFAVVALQSRNGAIVGLETLDGDLNS